MKNDVPANKSKPFKYFRQSLTKFYSLRTVYPILFVTIRFNRQFSQNHACAQKTAKNNKFPSKTFSRLDQIFLRKNRQTHYFLRNVPSKRYSFRMKRRIVFSQANLKAALCLVVIAGAILETLYSTKILIAEITHFLKNNNFLGS